MQQLERRVVSRRDFVQLAGLGGAGLVASACAAPARPAAVPASRSPSGMLAGPEVKFGAVFPLTGRWADFARKNSIAVQVAARVVNARGAIEGLPIRRILFDDASQPEAAAGLVSKLALEEPVL